MRTTLVLGFRKLPTHLVGADAVDTVGEQVVGPLVTLE